MWNAHREVHSKEVYSAVKRQSRETPIAQHKWALCDCEDATTPPLCPWIPEGWLSKYREEQEIRKRRELEEQQLHEEVLARLEAQDDN